MLQTTEMNFEKLSGSSYCLNSDKFCALLKVFGEVIWINARAFCTLYRDDSRTMIG